MKRILKILVVVFSIGILISVIMGCFIIFNSDPANRLFEKGVKYKQSGQYVEAINVYTEIITLHPDSTRAHYHRAELYEIEKEYEQAIQDYSKLIELFPDDSSARQKRANIYQIIGRDDLADVDHKVYHKIREGEKRKLQGREYEQKGNDDEAIQAYSDAIALTPGGGTAEMYSSRGKLYKSSGRSDLADADYKMANSKRKEMNQRDKENGFDDYDFGMDIMAIVLVAILIGLLGFLRYLFNLWRAPSIPR